MPHMAAEFHPLPITVRIAHEFIEVRTPACAAQLLRSLRHDRLGRYAEMLLKQLEVARTIEEKSRAWSAFAAWAMACGLHSDSESHPTAA